MSNDLNNTLGQLNSGIAAAATIITLVKTVRDMAKAAHPDAPEGTFPTNAQLIGDLASKSGLLKEEAHELQEWLKTVDNTPPTP